jgi:hypothetical protein
MIPPARIAVDVGRHVQIGLRIGMAIFAVLRMSSQGCVKTATIPAVPKQTLDPTLCHSHTARRQTAGRPLATSQRKVRAPREYGAG